MQQPMPPYPNHDPHHPPRRRLTRAEMRIPLIVAQNR